MAPLAILLLLAAQATAPPPLPPELARSAAEIRFALEGADRAVTALGHCARDDPRHEPAYQDAHGRYLAVRREAEALFGSPGVPNSGAGIAAPQCGHLVVDRFARLLVWRDLNSDGVATADELQTMAQAGIAALDLDYTQVDASVAGNVVARIGSYLRVGGGTRDMASVDFALDQSGDKPVLPENADVSDLIALPNLRGSASIADLRTAMYFDPTLRAMVEDLVFGDLPRHDLPRRQRRRRLHPEIRQPRLRL